MEPPNLLLICTASFSAVFVLLALLALVMRILMFVYPERVTASDAALFAAIAATTSAFHPGAAITKIEEIK